MNGSVFSAYQEHQRLTGLYTRESILVLILDAPDLGTEANLIVLRKPTRDSAEVDAHAWPI